MSLSQRCERKPAFPDLQYRPPNAQTYKVRDGDTFETLVRRPDVRPTGMSPLDLCFFNFKTRDPGEINWYLHHRVGCRKVTLDGFNYRFSATDAPGTVFLPIADKGEVCTDPTVCAGSRKAAMINPISGCQFVLGGNAAVKGDEPVYELSAFSAVNRHAALIARVGREMRVDPRLISAIMYMETTHGYYDAPLSWFGQNKSILPMNINVEYWGSTFGTRESLKDPETNIRAGTEMIFRIQNYLPLGAPVSHVATLYNNINASQVNEYGARVQKIYETQPWVKKK
jgi:hypothetical protein